MKRLILPRRSALMLAGAGLLAGHARSAGAAGAAADAGTGAAPTRSHALSLIGTPALPPGFPHFPYVNPDAPKGGEVVLGAIGGFDSFNPFILRGTSGPVGAVWDSLTVADPAEKVTVYGHLARVIEISADRKQVAFELRPDARFHDGKPVTAADVVWTFDTLRQKGRPFYRAYYADVLNAVAERPDRVVFHLRSGDNQELPQILGELAVLPRHWWQGRDFAEPLREPPLGSGPYRIGHFEFGRTLVLDRVPDWWALNQPTGKGLFNFDRQRTEYFRDATVALQAFKAGQVDYREENIAKDWATAYDFPARRQGLVILQQFEQHLPTGMQGFAMNTRRPVFANRLLRQAVAWAFDFEWANKNLFYGAYTRTRSYFSNSDLAASGLPSAAERALLEPFRAHLPPELFTRPFTLPVTDGSGNNREELRTALKWCRQAGYDVKNRRMVSPDGQPVRFEILLSSPTYERVALPYVQTLAKLGIEAHVRTVDPAQYQHQLDAFDFDMTLVTIPESERPGNEQKDYWTSLAARTPGSQNLMGVADPAVDALVAKVIAAPDDVQLIAATHALDRVLLWSWYVVPNWYLQVVRSARWNRFGFPDKPVRTGVAFNSWWVDPQRAAATDAARQAG